MDRLVPRSSSPSRAWRPSVAFAAPAPAAPPRRPVRSAATRWRAAALLLGAVLVLATGCASGAGPGGVLEWRDLTLDLPADWVELDRTDTSLSVGNAEPSTEPGERGALQVATQLTVEPGTSADDWRRFVEEQDATLERDTSTTVGGVPATVLQFSFTTNGVPTRERVVLVPSRDLVLLQQPVPMQGETAAPEWFDDRVDEFDALLDGIEFGAPADHLDGS